MDRQVLRKCIFSQLARLSACSPRAIKLAQLRFDVKSLARYTGRHGLNLRGPIRLSAASRQPSSRWLTQSTRQLFKKSRKPDALNPELSRGTAPRPDTPKVQAPKFPKKDPSSTNAEGGTVSKKHRSDQSPHKKLGTGSGGKGKGIARSDQSASSTNGNLARSAQTDRLVKSPDTKGGQDQGKSGDEASQPALEKVVKAHANSPREHKRRKRRDRAPKKLVTELCIKEKLGTKHAPNKIELEDKPLNVLSPVIIAERKRLHQRCYRAKVNLKKILRAVKTHLPQSPDAEDIQIKREPQEKTTNAPSGTTVNLARIDELRERLERTLRRRPSTRRQVKEIDIAIDSIKSAAEVSFGFLNQPPQSAKRIQKLVSGEKAKPVAPTEGLNAEKDSLEGGPKTNSKKPAAAQSEVGHQHSRKLNPAKKLARRNQVTKKQASVSSRLKVRKLSNRLVVRELSSSKFSTRKEDNRNDPSFQVRKVPIKEAPRPALTRPTSESQLPTQTIDNRLHHPLQQAAPRQRTAPPLVDGLELELGPPVIGKGYQWLILEPHAAATPALPSSLPSDLEVAHHTPVERMKSHVEVVSTHTADTRGFALMLEFSDKRYLIGNAHEGLQRALVQRGKRMQKVTDVFLTGKTEWKNTGGLLGLVLTCADGKQSARKAARDAFHKKWETKIERLRSELSKFPKGSKSQLRKQQEYDNELRAQNLAWKKLQEEMAATVPLGIHGGPNINYTVATARRFIFRKGMPLNVRECTSGPNSDAWQPSWSDEYIQVYNMPVHPETSATEKESQSRKRNLQQYLGEAKGREQMQFKPELNLQILQSVVGNMFDSDWTLDALEKVPLADVQTPATMFVYDEGRRLKEYTGPKPGEIPLEELPKLDVYIRKPWPGALVKTLPSASPSPVAMSYIFKNHPQRGKFLREKAVQLRVPVARYKELTAGKSITLEDGQVVTPEDVLGPGKPGGAFAIVELPSEEYVRPLVQRKEWDSQKIMDNVDTIFWILGPGLGENKDLARFMTRFDHLRHVVSSPHHSPNYLTYESSASATLRLASLDPFKLFPIPIYNNVPKEFPVATKRLTLAHPGQILNLEPNLSWDDSSQAKPLDTVELHKSLSADVKSIAQQVWKDAQDTASREELENQTLPGLDNELITLGTGSAAPSKYRNVSSTLLRVPGVGSYLFDAGENTLGQLARVYSPSELQEVLRDLRVVWISHLHADHHLGLTSVLKAWYEAKNLNGPGPEQDPREVETDPGLFQNRNKLAVVSEKNMIDWLQEYSQIEDFGWDHMVGLSVGTFMGADGTMLFDRRLAPTEALHFRSPHKPIKKALTDLTGLVDLQAVPVSHCFGAKAVSMTFEDGFKISYSGDCRPAARFVGIGQGSTVLLHEATFDDELAGDARAKKHSTTSEAIKVGLEMQAPRIMLTHFSQRYQKMPNMSGLQGRQVRFEDVKEETDSADVTGPVDDAEQGDTDGAAVVNSDDTTEVLDEDIQVNPDGDNGKEGLELRTHRSQNPLQRKDSDIVDNNALGGVKIGVAFDYLRVKVRDIALLERLSPVFTKLFDEEDKVKELPKDEKESAN